MRRGAHTIERFAQYVRPIELLEKAFRLAGLEIEYAVTYVGDYKAFEICRGSRKIRIARNAWNLNKSI